jgi:membrane protease YdiL (CAAX protease family)
MHMRVVLAWIVILSIVGFVVYSNIQRTEKTSGNQVNDLRMKIAAQEAIGLKYVQRNFNSPPNTLDTMLRTLDKSASTPEDAFHVAIVAAEIRGADAALERLNALADKEISSDLAKDVETARQIYMDGIATLDDRSREELTARHDFLARVALTFGADSQTEPRRSIERSAVQTLIVLGFLAIALLGLLLVSIVLFITAIILMKTGKIRRAYIPTPSANSAFLEVFALYLALFVLMGFAGRALHVTSLNWNWAALLIIPVAAYWAVRRGITLEACRQAVGWYRGRGWFHEAAAGICGYLAGLVVVAIGLFITAALARWSGAVPQHPITQMLNGDRWHILALYATACVFAPVMEETMFRGALFHHLRSRWRWLLSAPIVATIFAIIHPQGWVALPVLGAIALVLAALREWRGSLIAPMTAHALNNFVALSVALLVLRN